MDNDLLWDSLANHTGHRVEITYYGSEKSPACRCLECLDCNEVVLDAEIYTLCARNDQVK